ncbi:MAG: translation initiation factor [Nitrospira sp.]|nr:MAG: translation initiation factor [Nitrospira sp.]
MARWRSFAGRRAVAASFVNIGQAEKAHLVKEVQKACGAGGTVKEGWIEIHGDQREAIACILTNAGFHPMSARG